MPGSEASNNGLCPRSWKSRLDPHGMHREQKKPLKMCSAERTERQCRKGKTYSREPREDIPVLNRMFGEASLKV